MPVRLRPALLAALGLVLAGSLLTAGTAVAGTPAMGANATLGLPCMGFEVQGSVPVTVKQKRGGTIIAQRTFVPATDGHVVCLKTLKAGDQLLIQQGVESRTATAPVLTATVDLAANTVGGTTSLIGSTVTIQATELLSGVMTGEDVSRISGPVTGSKTFSATTTPDLDLQRGDRVSTGILTATDEWFREVRTGSILLQTGRATASGSVPVGAKATAILRSPTGVIRGRFTVGSGRDRTHAGQFTGTFRKGGKPVKVRPGDRVTFSGLPTRFVVRKPTLVVDPAGTGSLTASCPAGGEWVILVGTLRRGIGTTPGSGTVSVSDLGGVASGDHVKLVCSNNAGWATQQEVVVP